MLALQNQFFKMPGDILILVRKSQEKLVFFSSGKACRI